MAETYSQSVLGYNGKHATYPVQVTKVGDTGGGTPGLQASSMQTGLQILCQRPDGSKAWFTIDASRSIPGGPLYLLPV